MKNNPSGLMPVLRDGDQWIQDSDKIFEHLESKFPEPPLKPSDSAKQVYVIDALVRGSRLILLVAGRTWNLCF
jgi:glutathione S-transferase